MRKGWIAALGLVLSASAASAGDIDAFKTAGLEGKWAVDCAKPASATNVHATWTSTADGHIVLTTDTDKKDDSPATLVSFQKLPEGRVVYTVKSDPDDIDVVLKLEPKRYRMWSSSISGMAAAFAGGTFYVKDGKLVSNGKETEWYNRCGK